MQFWKANNGVDKVFHQTLNLAIFWETFKEYFPSVNQKPVLAISREIYIPANWHQLKSTDMLKHRVIFTSVGALNQRPIRPDSWQLGEWKRLLPIFFKWLFQTYLRNECKEGGSKEFWTKRKQRIAFKERSLAISLGQNAPWSKVSNHRKAEIYFCHRGLDRYVDKNASQNYPRWMGWLKYHMQVCKPNSIRYKEPIFTWCLLMADFYTFHWNSWYWPPSDC